MAGESADEGEDFTEIVMTGTRDISGGGGGGGGEWSSFDWGWMDGFDFITGDTGGSGGATGEETEIVVTALPLLTEAPPAPLQPPFDVDAARDAIERFIAEDCVGFYRINVTEDEVPSVQL